MKKVGHVQILELFNEIEDVFEYFKANLGMKNMCKFLFNYMDMFQRSQEFVYASRTQNWQLHLESCQKLSIDFHATDRIKYMRMFPYYIKTRLVLETEEPYIWQSLKEGQFSVVKSKLPFVGIGVDHAGEQENKVLKVSGGLRGIATNINARNRFFAIVPLIHYLCEMPAVTAKHHNTSLLQQRQRNRNFVSTK